MEFLIADSRSTCKFKKVFTRTGGLAGTSSPVEDRCEPAEISLKHILQACWDREKRPPRTKRKRFKIRTADAIVADRLVLVYREIKDKKGTVLPFDLTIRSENE